MAIAFLPLVARLGPAATVGFGADHPGDPAVSRTEFRPARPRSGLDQRAVRANRGGLW